MNYLSELVFNLNHFILFINSKNYPLLEDAEYFQLSNSENVVQLTLKRPLTEEDLSNRQYFLFEIVAKKGGSLDAKTNIFISLPEQECTDLPDLPEDNQPVFESTLYNFGAITDFRGRLGFVKAKVTDESIQPTYALIITNNCKLIVN